MQQFRKNDLESDEVYSGGETVRDSEMRGEMRGSK